MTRRVRRTRNPARKGKLFFRGSKGKRDFYVQLPKKGEKGKMYIDGPRGTEEVSLEKE